MSAAVYVAVAWLAWMTCAAEYVDYSGAHMPLFEGEYDPPPHPHPQPHPQPHRETTESSSIPKEDPEGRPLAIKKPYRQRRPVDGEDDIIDIFEKYKYEEPSSFDSSDPRSKRWPARIGHSRRDEPAVPPRAPARRPPPWTGGGGDEYDEPADPEERESDRPGRVRMLDDEGYRPPRRRNGKMRRKPRARAGRNRLEDDPDDDDDDVGRSRAEGDDAVNFDRREEPTEADDEAQRWGGGEAQDEEAAEDESTAPPPPPPARTRAPYYREYYDMQRVKSIKNKLPALKRRTQARPREPGTATRAPGGGAWAGPRRPPAALAHLHPDTLEDDAGTASPTRTDPPTLTPGPPTERTDADQLSIAEKSRLSILKKAQRKESVDAEAGTAKPPVLLQVTQRPQTVVMVEGGRRGGGGGGGGNVRLVAQDSPERLAKVRRLMRHKLVAGARSVQDLTDNWDELVCDYFDVRALDSAAPGRLAQPLLLLLCFSVTSIEFI